MLERLRIDDVPVSEELKTATVPYEERLRTTWGAQYDDLLRYLSAVTGSRTLFGDKLRKGLSRNHAKTLIVVGERGGEDTEPRRMPEAQFLAAVEVVKAIERQDWHLLFTGGCNGLPIYGEIPARDLAQYFEQQTHGVYAPRVSIDGLSENTGHQGRLLAAMVKTFDFQQLVLVMTNEHIGRMLATIAFGLRDLGITIPLIPAPYGRWDLPVVGRKMTQAEEAFGPIQGLDDPRLHLAGKRLGGEYAERLAAECDPTRNSSFACGALSPREMFEQGYLVAL